jgi:hypothetical protein
LAKIAYEFLACHLGDIVYETGPQLSAVRDAIRGEAEDSDAFSVEYLTSHKYSPVHGLLLAGHPYVVVSVCLFDWLRFRVHFPQIAVARPYFAYSCLLDSGEEALKEWNEVGSEDEAAG